jgi:hypothetical protein
MVAIGDKATAASPNSIGSDRLAASKSTAYLGSREPAGIKNETDESTLQRFKRPLLCHPGLDTLRRRRTDLIDLQGVGRLENRQGGPDPDRRRDARVLYQLSESHNRVGGQGPNVSPEE